MILFELVAGSLLSAALLWVIGRKMQYDFLFRNLLIITFCSSLGGLIPLAGIYVGAAVFIILFCLLERMPASEVMWVALIAFVIKWSVVMILMLSVKSAMVYFSGEDGPKDGIRRSGSIEDAPTQKENQIVPESAGSNSLSSGVAADSTISGSAPSPEEIPQQYRVSGIASMNGQRIAIVNGRILREGDTLDNAFHISRIGDDFVDIASDDETYRVYRE